ncbi:UNVERIFIED_CONTAM: hypothetical protein H355_010256 [Colinus virginianus]|nr:hypothetical protein H355_010256 [Colinus virginianus]
MLLHLAAEFDLQRDVVPWLAARGWALDTSENSSALYIVNVERNGKIIYTWKGNQRNTHIGLYDLQTKENEHLYMFEKDLRIISCSVNSERTLLAVSFRQYTEEERVTQLLQSVSKYLTLLIEIHPINNVRVLKAVDSCVRVQLDNGDKKGTKAPWIQLTLHDIEQFDIHVAEEEHKVVIQNSGQLPRARVADDLIWAQWDMTEQRLFYIVPKLESQLDISVDDTQVKLVNFGYDDCRDQDVASKSLNLQVFTSKAGYSKTFTVSLDRPETPQLKEVVFLNLGYYVAAYLPGQFLHLLNIQHPDLLCYSLFLTGDDARIDMLPNCSIQSPLVSTVLDCCLGRMYTVSISDSDLLKFLQNSKWDSERLAALHCALLCIRSTTDLEMKIQNSKGFWEKLDSNLESVKYAEPHLHYHNDVLRREWRNLLEEGAFSSGHLGLCYSHVFSAETAIEVEDLFLPNHFTITSIYLALLPENIASDERGSKAEFMVFHIMTRILEAANGMCMPLPPDLDDNEKNEKLKFSIVTRLPEALGLKARQFWDHPINANFLARKYVKLLLEKLGNRQCSCPVPERHPVPVEFLPLNYLTNMLAAIENQGVHPYEKQDPVNVRFVEEAALKHTMMLLGLRYS